MMKRILKYTVALLLMSFPLMAQDIHFSQFFMAPLNMSPAYMGVISHSEANLNYKTQWRTVTVPYKTFGASVSSRINSKRNQFSNKGYDAVGVGFYNDVAGDGSFGSLQVSGNFAHHFQISRNITIGAGLMAGLGQRSIDNTKFQTGAQYSSGSYQSGLSTGENFVNQRKLFFDGGAGIVLHRQEVKSRNRPQHDQSLRFTLGITAFHINQPSISFLGSGEKLYIRYLTFGMAEFPLGTSSVSLVPAYQLSFQGPATELVFGGLVRYSIRQGTAFTGLSQSKAVALGVFHRLKDAISVTALLEFDRYGLGLCYDINTSSLTLASQGRGGMEVSIRVRNPFHVNP
jgi:type IX secretion system PorP/SprF family membrane protein